MNLIETIALVAAILGLIVLVGRVLYPPYLVLKTFLNWLDKFRRDWEGEEAEPGRDKVSGVMERLNRLDGELSNNGGLSLKDAVNRIELKLSELMKR